MRHISIAKTAMAVGTVFAASHIMWVVLVGVGWATAVLKFVLEMHFLKINFELAPYSAFTAFSLVAITFCVGALLGAIFALVWNWLTLASEPEWARDTEKRSAATN
ncbi:MAG TPA: hypothetical protein VIV07_07970 [Sphingomicrobium sp.]